jgi:hypothetical protein
MLHQYAKKTGAQRPPARLKYFNEFYLLNKSVNIVIEKKQTREATVLVSTLLQLKGNSPH